MRSLSAAVSVLSLVCLAGCDGGPAPDGRVVTTTGMVTDTVRTVAGEHAEVVGLMGEGVDPHLYKPTRSDVKQLMDAEVVFYSGQMLEGRMGDLFEKLARSGKPCFAVTGGLEESYLLAPPGFEGHPDPHVWMDVAAWSECVGHVAETLARNDPAHADAYRQNAETYRAELAELDTYVRQVIATIPEGQRVLVTAHDAFGYFSRAYDIPVRSVQGISTESEAGVDDIVKLVDLLVERKIRAIFVETSVSEKNIRAVIEGAADRGHDVRIGGELFSDAMGPAGTYEGTYIGMIDHNATPIARALGGEAPERGFRGKLAPP
jgi:manganese/zinc/iron transport system substrate-binding protein